MAAPLHLPTHPWVSITFYHLLKGFSWQEKNALRFKDPECLAYKQIQFESNEFFCRPLDFHHLFCGALSDGERRISLFDGDKKIKKRSQHSPNSSISHFLEWDITPIPPNKIK